MPQPQPNSPNIMHSVGIALAILGVICVFLFLGGLGCKVAGLTGDANPEADIGCTTMISSGLIGGIVVACLKALIKIMPK